MKLTRFFEHLGKSKLVWLFRRFEKIGSIRKINVFHWWKEVRFDPNYGEYRKTEGLRNWILFSRILIPRTLAPLLRLLPFVRTKKALTKELTLEIWSLNEFYTWFTHDCFVLGSHVKDSNRAYVKQFDIAQFSISLFKCLGLPDPSLIYQLRLNADLSTNLKMLWMHCPEE